MADEFLDPPQVPPAEIDPSASQIITPTFIEERLGSRLSVWFPQFETSPSAMIEFHEELDRLEKTFGSENVFGSLFFESDDLKLGIFVKTEVIPKDLDEPPAVVTQ